MRMSPWKSVSPACSIRLVICFSSWLSRSFPPDQNGKTEMIQVCATWYQLPKGKSAGLATEYFNMIHRVGRSQILCSSSPLSRSRLERGTMLSRFSFARNSEQFLLVHGLGRQSPPHSYRVLSRSQDVQCLESARPKMGQFLVSDAINWVLTT